jgi:hypothetical protein
MNQNESKQMNGFTTKQWQYIAARLISKTDAEASKRIGLTPSTVSAWQEKQAINDWLADVRVNHAAGVIASLDAYALQASARLAKLMASQDEAIALRASLAIIDHTIGKPKQKLTAVNEAGTTQKVLVIDYGMTLDDEEDE